jgi:hypothetical protein
LVEPAFAFREECLVDDEFALENFVIGQTKLSEPAGNPAQAFSGGMRFGRAGISGSDNFAEQNQRGLGQVVFL